MDKAEFESKRKELTVLKAEKVKKLAEEKRLLDLAKKGLLFAPQEKSFHDQQLSLYTARKNKFDDLTQLAEMMLSKLDQLEGSDG